MEKNLDSKGRWRNKTVAFRVSPEEAKQIDARVRLVAEILNGLKGEKE